MDFDFETWEARLKKLEIHVKRKLLIKDMPLKELRRAVLMDEPSDPLELLLPNSITNDLVAPGTITADEMADNTVTRAELAPGFKTYAYGIVTSLPTSPAPVTGDTCVYTDSLSAPSFRWQLVYLSTNTGSYDWQVIGGDPLFAESTSNSTHTGTSYEDLAAGAGPGITIPLAGDYIVHIEGASVDSSDWETRMSYAIGGTAAVDSDATPYTRSGGVYPSTKSRTRIKLGLAASTALVGKYKRGGAGGTTTWHQREISAMPIRVG